MAPTPRQRLPWIPLAAAGRSANTCHQLSSAARPLLGSAAVMHTLWPHLTTSSKRSLRLCCTTLRNLIDAAVVTVAAPPSLVPCELRAAAQRWPNAHGLSVDLTAHNLVDMTLLAVMSQSFLNLQQLSIHLVPPASLDALVVALDDGALARLTHLDLSCSRLTDLAPLAWCAALLTLNLTACCQLVDITPLAQCTRLQRLLLAKCRRIATILPHPSLRHLNLAGCVALRSLAPLASCTQLLTLDLSASAVAAGSGTSIITTGPAVQPLHGGCHLLSPVTESFAGQLSPLLACTDLRRLSLSRCLSLRDLSALRHLSMLQHLDLTRCSALTTLSHLSAMTSLRHLCLASCHQLSTLGPVASLFSLTTLDASFCWALVDLSPLSTCTTLRCLSFSGCHLICSLAPLRSCTALRWLDVSLCPQIADVSALAACTQLKYLDASGTAVQGENAAAMLAPYVGLTVLKLNLEGEGEPEEEEEEPEED